LFKQLEQLGEKALRVYDKADSGPIGKRCLPAVHTFSSAMCWAACDRLAKIADELKINDRGNYWRKNADNIRDYIMKKCFNTKLNSFVSVLDSDDVDAFLLLLPEIGIVNAKDEVFTSTLKVIEQKLKVDLYIKMNESDEVAHISATCL
jgi:GH15 family glucan-1,4-alpha-glucosidase